MSTNSTKFTDDFVDGVLFGNGLALTDYFIRKSQDSEVICYLGESGESFYLSIGDDDLFKALLVRLRELGARVVTLGSVN